MEQKFASLQIVKIIEKLGNEKVENFFLKQCQFLLYIYLHTLFLASQLGS